MPELTSKEFDPLYQRCHAEILNGGWDDLILPALSIEANSHLDKSHQLLLADFEYVKTDNPRMTAAILKDLEVPVGYALALPRNKEHALVSSAAIVQEYQHHGLIGKIMHVLELELRRQGFRYINMNALMSNGVAQTFERFYGMRIEYSEVLNEEYKYLVIKL